MIYKLIAGKDPFELNEGLRAIKAYTRLSPREMFFVLLVADPSKDNPVKTLTGKQRRERAAIIAEFLLEPDGKRLDKNGRNTVDGKIEKVEQAIEEFKRNHYNEHQRNKEALKKQIGEIRDFLESDKQNDPKMLKLAVELGVKLPDLESALDKLEAMEPENNRFEGTTYTSADIPEEYFEEGGDESLNAIELFHRQNSKKEENGS